MDCLPNGLFEMGGLCFFIRQGFPQAAALSKIVLASAVRCPAAAHRSRFPRLYACCGNSECRVMGGVPQPTPSTIPLSSKFKYLTKVL